MAGTIYSVTIPTINWMFSLLKSGYLYNNKRNGGDSMNNKDHGTEDKLKGIGNKVKGSVKDTVGDLTDNTKMQAEGKWDKAKGATQEKIGKAKEHFSDDEAHPGK